jgi:predicted phage baseplate assembly protein
MRLKAYLTGGGRHGNAEAGKITILRDSIPFVTSVKNRFAASGGVDAESLEDAKRRGSVLLRTRNRAVTAEDYEALARESSPEVARIRAVAAGDGSEAGTVRMLVVPSATDEDGRLGFEQLIPADETLERIAMYLDERRTIGTRVVVEPPVYQGIRIDARVKLRPGSSGDRVKRDAIAALYRYYHALIGGPEGDGWPFGRPIHVGEVHSVLQRVDGVDYVVDALLRAADPVGGELSDAMQRIDIDNHALVFSYEHQVLVEGA